MNIKQLRDYLDTLLASGADPATPVCVAADAEASEVNNITIASGPFREDPAPKMPAFINSSGQFLFLETCDDYEWMSYARYPRLNGPQVPAKEWKPGEEWWLGGRENFVGTDKTVLHSVIAPRTGQQTSSIREQLSAEEQVALEAWSKAQPAGENGAIDLMKWPGWSNAFLRKYGE